MLSNNFFKKLKFNELPEDATPVIFVMTFDKKYFGSDGIDTFGLFFFSKFF